MIKNSWWTKWHLDKFFLTYFTFRLSISFHQCFIIVYSPIMYAVQSYQLIGSFNKTCHALHFNTRQNKPQCQTYNKLLKVMLPLEVEMYWTAKHHIQVASTLVLHSAGPHYRLSRLCTFNAFPHSLKAYLGLYLKLGYGHSSSLSTNQITIQSYL